jgi:hypothetical protein
MKTPALKKAAKDSRDQGEEWGRLRLALWPDHGSFAVGLRFQRQRAVEG